MSTEKRTPTKSEVGVPPDEVRKQIHGTVSWFDHLTYEQQEAYVKRYPDSKISGSFVKREDAAKKD